MLAGAYQNKNTSVTPSKKEEVIQPFHCPHGGWGGMQYSVVWKGEAEKGTKKKRKHLSKGEEK
jgi:hypothetical protein